MKNKLDQAPDKLLVDSLAALRRAARSAREEAIRAGTEIVVVREGHVVRLTADELSESIEQ